MAETVEEIELMLEELEQEMFAEKSIKVDGKITVERRTQKELASLYSLYKDKLNRLTGYKVSKVRRGGFE